MGHNQKNQNRAAAINKNTARVEKLAEKIGEVKEITSKEVGELESYVNDFHKKLEDFCDSAILLHAWRNRPWWRRLLGLRPKEEKMVKEKKKKEPPTPKHRQVTVDPHSRSAPKDRRVTTEKGEKNG